MNKKIFGVLSCIALMGCAATTNTSEQTAQTSAINDALTLCGIGKDSLAQLSLKAALNIASQQPGADFEKSARDQIETQITILLKQAELKSDSAFKFAADQINADLT